MCQALCLLVEVKTKKCSYLRDRSRDESSKYCMISAGIKGNQVVVGIQGKCT